MGAIDVYIETTTPYNSHVMDPLSHPLFKVKTEANVAIISRSFGWVRAVKNVEVSQICCNKKRTQDNIMF